MEAERLAPQRRLLTVAAGCAVVFVPDLIFVNLGGDIPSGWWLLSAPVGLILARFSASARLLWWSWTGIAPSFAGGLAGPSY